MALKGIDETLTTLLDCIDLALRDDGVPACVVATSVGDPVISNCCECAAGVSGELWGQFKRVYPGDRVSGAETRGRKPCAPVMWVAQYQITLARCYPTIGERGEIEPQDRSEAAAALHADVATIQRALHCCDAMEEPPYVEQVVVSADPSGGCSSLNVFVRVPISMSRSNNPRAIDVE